MCFFIVILSNLAWASFLFAQSSSGKHLIQQESLLKNKVTSVLQGFSVW